MVLLRVLGMIHPSEEKAKWDSHSPVPEGEKGADTSTPGQKNVRITKQRTRWGVRKTVTPGHVDTKG